MDEYLALLRGINVGGHRKLPMSELRSVAATIGFGEPATHLASGNLVFSAGGAEPSELEHALEQAG